MSIQLPKTRSASTRRVSRALRLERLESRLFLSANPMFFTLDVDNHRFGRDRTESSAVTSDRHSDTRDEQRRIDSNRGGRQVHDIRSGSEGNRPRQLRDDETRNNPNFGSSRPSVQNDSGNAFVIDFAISNFGQQTDNRSQPNPVTVTIPVQSINFATLVPHSSNESSELTSGVPLTQSVQNRSERETAAVATSAVPAATVSSNATEQDTGEQTLVSLVTAEDSAGNSQWRTGDAAAAVRVSAFHTSPTVDLEIHRWLDEAEDLQDKYDELDRALNELAEEQSRQAIAPQHTGSPHQQRNLEEPTSVWLAQTDNFLVAASTTSDSVVLAQSDLAAKLTEVANGGWTVGIGLFKTFETSVPNQDIVLASVVSSIESELLITKNPAAKSNQEVEPSTLDTNPIIIGVSISAIGLWHLRQQKTARRKNQPSCGQAP